MGNLGPYEDMTRDAKAIGGVEDYQASFYNRGYQDGYGEGLMTGEDYGYSKGHELGFKEGAMGAGAVALVIDGAAIVWLNWPQIKKRLEPAAQKIAATLKGIFQEQTLGKREKGETGSDDQPAD